MEDCYFEQEKQKFYEMFPREVRRLVPYVERECDRLEYTGSRMFDAYPDVGMMDCLCRRIAQQVDNGNEATKAIVHALLGFEFYTRRCRNHAGCRRR